MKLFIIFLVLLLLVDQKTCAPVANSTVSIGTTTVPSVSSSSEELFEIDTVVLGPDGIPIETIRDQIFQDPENPEILDVKEDVVYLD
ncbi:unnamed protein product [Caenorhabditis angaria]|uniref:Uncharacterized protein n=1 Tax=Caenorhabditis angaria TaxID=860376 RepID=A0A9P1N0I4_9PELO|nr:unnamed protein product [Caenorhabditis angaria]